MKLRKGFVSNSSSSSFILSSKGKNLTAKMKINDELRRMFEDDKLPKDVQEMDIDLLPLVYTIIKTKKDLDKYWEERFKYLSEEDNKYDKSVSKEVSKRQNDYYEDLKIDLDGKYKDLLKAIKEKKTIYIGEACSEYSDSEEPSIEGTTIYFYGFDGIIFTDKNVDVISDRFDDE